MTTTEATIRPTVSGPIGTAGSHGWAFARPTVDLDALGYVEEEFFLDGTAAAYRPTDSATAPMDGRWQAESSSTAPFTTRIIVYRPVDADAFNGTVICSWNNVTAGYELFGGDSPEFFNGYAFVGVTTQRVGIVGLPQTEQGLASWDPERYGSLSILSDDYSYDLFTQAGRAVGPDRDTGGADPLGGLAVERVVAMGASQSAGRLSAYINAIHPLVEVFDGFLLTIYFGTSSPLEVGGEVVNILAPSTDVSDAMRGANTIRTDTEVPVFIVNSELEGIAMHEVLQPDADRFRYWESAGTAHLAVSSQELRGEKFLRDFGRPFPVAPGINQIPMTPLYDSALHHLHRWLTGQGAPPIAPRLEFDEGGDSPEIVRDDLGIARGGIRLPLAEVPLGQNSAIPLTPDIYAILGGSCHPFSEDQLVELYGDESTYVERFDAAVDALADTGILLPHDAAVLRENARAVRFADR